MFGNATPTDNASPAADAGDINSFLAGFAPKGGLPVIPKGIFDAVLKSITPKRTDNFDGVVVDFELTDPDYAGERVAMLFTNVNAAPKAKRKGALATYMRFTEAMMVLGATRDGEGVLTSDVMELIGESCRVVVTERNGNADLVWGKPKNWGGDVPHPVRDYGCGVLPAE